MIRRFWCMIILLVVAAQPVAARPSVRLHDGVLQLRSGDGVVVDDMRLRLRTAAGSTISGDLVVLGADAGSDTAGSFERMRWRLGGNSAGAVLELRHYVNGDAVVGLLEYDGPELAEHHGITLRMALPACGRMLAIHRHKPYWTAPVFTSDYRLLPPDNVLLLWQRPPSNDYEMLAPLSGDGEIGEVGAADYEFGVRCSAFARGARARRVPLFVWTAGPDPYALGAAAYRAAFAAAGYEGRLRVDKPFPDVYRGLGWCSWNTYYEDVTADKVMASVRSLHQRGIPVRFVLIDDGWLSVARRKLIGYEADGGKFPGGLARLVTALKHDFGVAHVGVWHAFQGYWEGVDSEAAIGKSHALLAGIPDPRDLAGESFYDDWYKFLKSAGIDFVKVDNQAGTFRFTDGVMPRWDASAGEQRNLQQAALKWFGGNVLNCMAMSPDNAFNWRVTNLARSSDDYDPNDVMTSKDHIYQNAYNTFWLGNFAWPDYDMFQTHAQDAVYHAMARVMSGGPIYTTDEPGKERPDLLARLAFHDGSVPHLDQPGQVARRCLLRNPALEAVPLEMQGAVTRPGYWCGVLGTWNVNKMADSVSGSVRPDDVEGLPRAERYVVRSCSTGRIFVVDADQGVPVTLGAFGSDLWQVVPVNDGVAVLGDTDKYLAAGCLQSVRQRSNHVVEITLHERGTCLVWLQSAPLKVTTDGRAGSFDAASGLLRFESARQVLLTCSPTPASAHPRTQ